MAKQLFPDLPEADGVIDNPSDEDYATAARFALKKKNLPRALEQVAAALAFVPNRSEHLRLLEEILAASRSPAQLVKLPDNGVFFGLLAVHARVLYRAGDVNEALQTLIEVATFRPNVPFLEWARSWVADSARRIDAELLASALLRFIEAATQASIDDGLRTNVSAAAEIAQQIAMIHAGAAIKDTARLLRVAAETSSAFDGVDGSLTWRRDLGAYRDILVDPVDPVIRAIRGSLNRATTVAEGQRIRIRVQSDGPAAPSAQTCFELGLEAIQRAGTLVVDSANATSAGRYGGFWTKEGEQFVAVAESASAQISGVVQELAVMPFHWRNWCAKAAGLLQTNWAQAVQIFSVMTRPPPIPSGVDAVHWVHRVQIAGALIVACAPVSWSERVLRLDAMLAAADDWIAAAGVLGLRAATQQDDATLSDVRERLLRLFPVGREPLCPYARALAVSGSELFQETAATPFLELRRRVVLETS